MLDGVVNALVKGEFRTPADLFCSLEELGMIDTVKQCNDLLLALRRANQYKTMLSFLEFMKKSEMSPNEVTYSLIITACRGLSDLTKAALYFDQLKNSSGIIVTAHSYRAMIITCLAFSNYNKARAYFNEMLEDMLEMDGELLASIVHQLLYEKKHLDEAAELCLAIFETMETNGIQSNAKIRRAAVRIYSKVQYHKQLRALYETIKDCDDELRIDNYNDILYGLRKKEEHLDLSDRIHEDMKADGICPTMLTYHLLLSFLSPTGTSHRSLMLLNEMEESGLQPNLATYNCAIQAFAKVFPEEERGEVWSSVQKLLERMEAQEIQSDVVTYDLLLTICILTEDPDRAVKYYEEMKTKRIPSDDRIFRKLIELNVQLSSEKDAKGNSDRVFVILEQMEKERVKLDCQICIAAIRSFRAEKDAEAAKNLVAKMNESGVIYDKILLRTLFEFWILVGDKKMTQSTLEEALRQNKIPGTIIQTVLLEALVRAEQIPLAVEHLRNMMHSDVQFSSVTYKVIELLNQYELSEEIRREIKKTLGPDSPIQF